MKLHYDVIIVGTGAAGLYTALSLPTNLHILMISKNSFINSDSYLAQGGISTLRNKEDYTQYYEDTMKAGHYENDPESVRVMIEESPAIIDHLQEFGVLFDRNTDGTLRYTREGGHSTFRILHHKDVTGKEIVSKLLARAKERANLTLLEFTTLLDLIEEHRQCHGVIIRTSEGQVRPLYASCVVLATGGIGGLFKSSTNFSHISGDSFAIALKHKITVSNLHYIQIHPTVLYSKKPGRRFLISESVRGEGAILLNENKERFVDELLPRDMVTAAIKEEMDRFHTDYVYLSLNTMAVPDIQNRFPNIYQRCLEEGYQLGKDFIPVAPAQHYLMGGITTSTSGATSMKRLYAVGETACNGVHGVNRLASNSLLESLVFAGRAAKEIQKLTPLMEPKSIALSLHDYEDMDALQEEHRQLLLREIKEKDSEFYAKWCNNETKYR